MQSEYFSFYKDKFAQEIGWNTVKNGGQSFKSHRLKQVDRRIYRFDKTPLQNVFPVLFIGIGMLILFFHFEVKELSLLWLTIGMVFPLFGIFFFFLSYEKIVFDGYKEIFWKGIRPPNSTIQRTKTEVIEFEEIYAIQIVRELIKGSEGDNYMSYELNLVLKSKERINVVDHGNYKELLKDATVLSQFLQVPYWDGCIPKNSVLL